MKENILIIGDGFIGKNLFKYFSKYHSVEITNIAILNVERDESISSFFLSPKKYDYIIYAAGNKDIKDCEDNPEAAFSINAEAVKKLLSIASPQKFIYLSTDYIFDGNKGNYTEEDAPNPQTIYGKSKLLGEWYTQAYASDYLIVRTSGVYGDHCGWVKWLLEEVNNNREVVCFSNVYNSPTSAINLAEMIDDMIGLNFSGVINLCGPTALSRYSLYKAICRKKDLQGSKLVKGIDDSARFPSNLSLNTFLYESLTSKTPKSLCED